MINRFRIKAVWLGEMMSPKKSFYLLAVVFEMILYFTLQQLIGQIGNKLRIFTLWDQRDTSVIYASRDKVQRHQFFTKEIISSPTVDQKF